MEERKSQKVYMRSPLGNVSVYLPSNGGEVPSKVFRQHVQPGHEFASVTYADPYPTSDGGVMHIHVPTRDRLVTDKHTGLVPEPRNGWFVDGRRYSITQRFIRKNEE